MVLSVSLSDLGGGHKILTAEPAVTSLHSKKNKRRKLAGTRGAGKGGHE